MESLIFSINAILPIILIVALGYFLKKKEFMTEKFAKMSNRLVFHFFLPSMLFLNIYKIEDLTSINLGFALYALIVVLIIFAIGIFIVNIVTSKKESRGVLLQGTFRSNYALIGIPLAKALFGDEGVLIAGLLSAIIVPLFNVLAVISLSIYNHDGEKPSVKKIILNILKNPLIGSIVLGIIVVLVRQFFISKSIDFRLSSITPLFSALNSLSSLATPLALLSLGAQFEFSAVGTLKKEIIFGCLMRTVFVPAIGLGGAYFLFNGAFNGAHFAAFIATFATPVAVSSVPMAQEMKGDTALAGQLVVWTTLFSALSVFIASFLLKFVGIF